MFWENVFFGFLGCGLGMVLTLMGIKMDTEALKQTVKNSRCKIASIWSLHYVAAPLCAVATSKMLSLDNPRTLAMYLVSITPPTVAASVVTFAVGGNVELATASSIITLISSFLSMPLIFSWMIDTTLIKSEVRRIEVPYIEMCGILIYFVLCKGVGILIQKRSGEIRKKSITVGLKYSSIATMLGALFIYFIKCSDLVEATFYGGKSWGKHYFGCVVFMVLYTICCVVVSLRDTQDRDAIIITGLRKNPGITLSVAALSLRRLEHEEYTMAMGMLLAYGMILDWCGIPVIITLRRLRKGYYCWKKKEEVIEDGRV